MIQWYLKINASFFPIKNIWEGMDCYIYVDLTSSEVAELAEMGLKTKCNKNDIALRENIEISNGINVKFQSHVLYYSDYKESNDTYSFFIIPKKG